VGPDDEEWANLSPKAKSKAKRAAHMRRIRQQTKDKAAEVKALKKELKQQQQQQKKTDKELADEKRKFRNFRHPGRELFGNTCTTALRSGGLVGLTPRCSIQDLCVAIPVCVCACPRPEARPLTHQTVSDEFFPEAFRAVSGSYTVGGCVMPPQIVSRPLLQI
jgi:hypothetical protein